MKTYKEIRKIMNNLSTGDLRDLVDADILMNSADGETATKGKALLEALLSKHGLTIFDWKVWNID